MSEVPLVTVIVLLDRGNPEPCLSSILAQEGVAFEVIAVVGTREEARALPRPEVVKGIVVTDRNPSHRRNQAVAQARGKYLAFIDDDAQAPPGWLARGIGYLEEHPEAAGIGGPNLCPDDAGTLERITDLVLCAPLIGAGSRAYCGGGQRSEARPGELHLVNFMVRKRRLDKLEGFNEVLGYGAEDTEYLYLAGRMGMKFIFDPELIVFHRRRPFGGPYFRQRFRLRQQSARLFVAYPKVYRQNATFLAALIGPPALVLLMVFLPLALLMPIMGLLFFLYLAATIALSHRSWHQRPGLALAAPIAFALHHAVNLAGLWWGLILVVLTGPGRVRNLIRSG